MISDASRGKEGAKGNTPVSIKYPAIGETIVKRDGQTLTVAMTAQDGKRLYGDISGTGATIGLYWPHPDWTFAAPENPYHELPPPPASRDLSPAEEALLRRHYLGRVRQEAKTMAMVIGITEPAALGWLIQRLNVALGPMVIDGDEL